jgi:ketosteroid isomerase-like protein
MQPTLRSSHATGVASVHSTASCLGDFALARTVLSRSPMTQDVPRGVIELYETWQKAFRTLDVALLGSLWDERFEPPIYIAEENPKALLSMSEIRAYLTAAPTVVESVPRWDELERAISVSNDVATIYARSFVTLKLRGVTRPLEGEVRTTHVLHQRGGRWLLIHYHESRQLDLAAVVAAG